MKIIGHAGANGLAPGNTLASLRKALEYPLDEIEFDVQVSADNIPLLQHDTVFTDNSGNHLAIKSVPFEQLKQHRPDVITLVEALDFLNHQRPLYIEIKRNVDTGPIIKTLQQYINNGWQLSEFRVGSYDQAVLLKMQAAFVDLQLIVIEDWSSIRAHRRAQQLQTKRISMLEYWLWSGFIRAMKHRGYELYCFHTYHPKSPFIEWLYSKLGLTGQTNNPQRARKWAKHGLAGVITDYPDLYFKKEASK